MEGFIPPPDIEDLEIAVKNVGDSDNANHACLYKQSLTRLGVHKNKSNATRNRAANMYQLATDAALYSVHENRHKQVPVHVTDGHWIHNLFAQYDKQGVEQGIRMILHSCSIVP